MRACYLHIFLLLTLSTRSASNVACFNDTKTVYYTNTSVPAALPPVTTLIGGWESATVSMYISKILLEEKMGLNVLLWPIASEDYDNWFRTYDTNYPFTQYEWLNNRYIDYIIEGWELNRARVPWSDSQNIRGIGTLGTVAYIHIFVPEHTIKEHANVVWYESLQEQEVIDIFLNDSLAIFDKYKGQISFSRFYKWSNGLDRFSLVHADNTTVQTRPFIFGFIPSYQMSMNLWDRMHMLGLNNTWDLWFVDSERQLDALMNEMVAKNMNFIAHLYSPSYAMGAFKLEKLNFPYPFPEGHCDHMRMCEERWDLLFKTVNVHAMNEYPEVLTFLSRMRLSTTDVNNMIAASNEFENSSAWDSVCKWLRENPEDWSNWIVDIERELPYRLDLNLSIMIALWFATAFISSLTLLALMYLLWNKEKPLIKAMSPAFLALAAFSGILVAFAGALWTLDEYEYGLSMCNRRWIFACTGNTVLFASLSLKTWRVWYIFRNPGHSVPNCKLYLGILLIYIPVAGLLRWRMIELSEKGFSIDTADGVQHQFQCPDTQSGIYLTIYQYIIAFVALFFCLKARNVPDDFNENIHIMYLCIFTMLLIGFGVIVFQHGGDTPDIRAILMCLSHLMATVLIEITVLGRTMYLLVSGKARRKARYNVGTTEL